MYKYLLRQRLKKGFTIVELVIVIAVIAILSAVLIPTFVNLAKSANTASDVALVRNINTLMAMDEAVNGKSVTMHQALQVAEKGGYIVDRITPTSGGNDIVWDSTTNRFALLKENSTTVVYADKDSVSSEKVNLWKIYSAVPAEQSYSVYLKGTDVTGDVGTLTVGFDAGANTAITAISYERANNATAQSVILRTNGGALTINAPTDTVIHYGETLNVNVIAVASASYEEFGLVNGNLFVESEHIFVGESGRVSSIVLQPRSNENKATSVPTVTASAGSTVGTIVVNTKEANTKVEVASGANVSTVAPGSEEVKDSMGSIVTGKETEETIVDTSKATLFAGGLGTESSPYLIATAEQFDNISKLISYEYYKQIADLELIAGLNVSLQGSYDGDGHKISAKLGSSGIIYPFDARKDTIVKNLNTYSSATCGISLFYSFFDADSVLIKNVNFYAVDNAIVNIASTNFGFICTNPIYDERVDKSKPQQITIDNCTNFASLQNTGASTAAFIGSGYIPNSPLPIFTMTNCKNYGNITGLGAYAGVALGNGGYEQYSKEVIDNDGVDITSKIIIDKCINYGVITANSAVGFLAHSNKGAFTQINSANQTGTYIVSATLLEPIHHTLIMEHF